MSTTTTLEDTAWDSNGIGETPSSANSNGRLELELITLGKEISLNCWGIEILYRLHRRAVSAIHIQMGCCMNNVCSRGKVLSVICKKKCKVMDRFEQQECDWCWDEKQGTKRTPMQKDEIALQNCVAPRCEFSLGCLWLILILRLWSRKKTRPDLIPLHLSPKWIIDLEISGLFGRYQTLPRLLNMLDPPIRKTLGYSGTDPSSESLVSL